jgi:MSHA biogenesis protein MshO
MTAFVMKQTQQQAFTLVELVIVIVIVSIIGTASVAYIRFSAQGYINVIERQAIGQQIYIGFEKVNRLLRLALPSSIRTYTDTTHKCIEWIPIVSSGYYLTDISAAVSAIEVVENQNGNFASHRLAIYPQVSDPDELYQLSTNTRITQGAVTQTDPTAGDDKVTLTLTAAHSFPETSSQKRFFLVNDPQMLCFQSDRLFYYQNYGFFAAITGAVSALPVAVPNRQLIVNQVNFGSSSFSYTQSFEQSNAIIDVQLGLALDSGVQTLNQQVHIRNVP